MDLNHELAVAAVANISIKNLTYDELIAINLAIKLNNSDIKNVIGYEKIKLYLQKTMALKFTL